MIRRARKRDTPFLTTLDREDPHYPTTLDFGRSGCISFVPSTAETQPVSHPSFGGSEPVVNASASSSSSNIQGASKNDPVQLNMDSYFHTSQKSNAKWVYQSYNAKTIYPISPLTQIRKPSCTFEILERMPYQEEIRKQIFDISDDFTDINMAFPVVKSYAKSDYNFRKRMAIRDSYMGNTSIVITGTSANYTVVSAGGPSGSTLILSHLELNDEKDGNPYFTRIGRRVNKSRTSVLLDTVPLKTPIQQITSFESSHETGQSLVAVRTKSHLAFFLTLNPL